MGDDLGAYWFTQSRIFVFRSVDAVIYVCSGSYLTVIYEEILQWLYLAHLL